MANTRSGFLQTDPIAGGSANSYDYVNQDPINKFDLAGECWGWGCGAISHAAGRFNHAVHKYTVDVVATGAYGVYVGARFMHQRSPVFSRPVWHDVESWGIHADMAIDRYKVRHHLGETSDYDEGPGSVVYLNPLHGLTRHIGFVGPAWHNAPGAWRDSRGRRHIDW